MKQKKIAESVAKAVTNVLNTTLRTEANSASCFIAYQPKAPKELERFRRQK